MTIRIKGIIFDMDNTILRSRIDFKHMKHSVYTHLVKERILPGDIHLNDYTSSTIIELARRSPDFISEVEKSVWEIVSEIEQEGMENAGLEEGVKELLEQLQDYCHLIVLTNNSQAAALKALRATEIEHYFDYIIGREQATLKPSPDGINYILGLYPLLSKEEWIAVGDAWIDGKAATDAGVRFIAYQANRLELERKGVAPTGYIREIKEVLNYL